MLGAAVFPGAQGFGIHTRAGSGGQVLRVTNLDTAGPGSLRAALETKGPRIVVFEVGGVIDLQKQDLALTEPFITIAGQTAPSPGITVIRGSLSIRTHDILMQHMRFRIGDAGAPKKSGYEPEVSTSGPDAYNIVIDHCSFSWAVDENMSVSGPRDKGPLGTSRRITLSNNIIAEGLRESSHAKGLHSMGTLVHDSANDIAVVGNFYAHNNQRNPYFKAFTTGVVVNNLIYNPGTGAISVNWPEGEWRGRNVTPQNARIAVVGNVMYHGVNTREGLGLVGPKGDVFMDDNLAFDIHGKPAPLVYGQVRMLADKPLWPEGLVARPASEVTEWVLRNAGARPKDRDEADTRLVREFRERKGRQIDSQDDVGGYPKTPMTRHSLQVPASGVDEWLVGMARRVE